MDKLTIQSLANRQCNWIDSYNPKFITLSEFNQLVPDVNKNYFIKDTEPSGSYIYQDRAYNINGFYLVVSFKSLKEENNYIICTNTKNHEGLVKYQIYKKYQQYKTVWQKIA